MIQTSTRKKCGNCKHFELSPPIAPNSKTTYFGRCHRPGWPHASTIGKRACPGHQARETERKHSTNPDPIQRAYALIWQAFGSLAEHRYPAAAAALEGAVSELRKLIARREVRR